MNTLAAASQSPGATIAGIIGIVAAVFFYWVPTITAWVRHVPNKGSVAVVNFFAFLLLIPWIVAMAMAMRDPHPAH